MLQSAFTFDIDIPAMPLLSAVSLLGLLSVLTLASSSVPPSSSFSHKRWGAGPLPGLSSSSSFYRNRRSVNFTPSWGKRSPSPAAMALTTGAMEQGGDGGYSTEAEAEAESLVAADRCEHAARSRRIERLVERLRVKQCVLLCFVLYFVAVVHDDGNAATVAPAIVAAAIVAVVVAAASAAAAVFFMLSLFCIFYVYG